jgi:hypothetical protein
MLSKPLKHRNASWMPGGKTVEANGRETLPSTPLRERVGLAAAPDSPDNNIGQCGGSKGNRDKQFLQGRLAGHAPMVLEQNCEPGRLQSIVLDYASNDSADDYSTTASLTSSNVLGSSASSSCDDAPSAPGY